MIHDIRISFYKNMHNTPLMHNGVKTTLLIIKTSDIINRYRREKSYPNFEFVWYTCNSKQKLSLYLS